MSQNTCARCAAKEEMEFGPDGLPYCSSCIFYSLNKQCYKCRMYIPVNELQQYLSFWMCPYCIQDMRDEERKHNEPKNEKLHMDALAYPEKCSRCNGDLNLGVYYWNGKHLCKKCMEDGQKEWEFISGGPSKGGQIIPQTQVIAMREVQKKESLLSNVLHSLGIKKRKTPEIVQLTKEEIKKVESSKPLQKEEPKPKMSSEIGLAKPMNEEKIQTIEIERSSGKQTREIPSGLAIEGPMKSKSSKKQIKPRKTAKK